MEYRPSILSKNNNVSHNQPVREFILLFFGITFFLLTLFWIAGLCVDHAVSYITPEMEAKIFSSTGFSAKKLVEGENLKQAELQRMVNSLSQCIDITYPLAVDLVDSGRANAMALPGGRIIVFTGLLSKVESENGLAFVLAHELAHFKNKDHLRGMGRGIIITSIAALITGAESGFTQLLTPTVNLNMAQYSQVREQLADKEALRMLNCCYGHVGGASEFFHAMTPDDDQKSSVVGRYFSSHPEALERIKNLQKLSIELKFDFRKVKELPEILK